MEAVLARSPHPEVSSVGAVDSAPAPGAAAAAAAPKVPDGKGPSSIARSAAVFSSLCLIRPRLLSGWSKFPTKIPLPFQIGVETFPGGVSKRVALPVLQGGGWGSSVPLIKGEKGQLL